SAAPSEYCVITKVVIGAQYASGSWKSRATSSEATAATAVRAECTKPGHPARPARSVVSSVRLRNRLTASPRLVRVIRVMRKELERQVRSPYGHQWPPGRCPLTLPR